MSQIYIKEPPTDGKVLLKTSLGDIDVELWSKEAPLACRNFVQLCMEGYYNGILFHRIVRDFVAQCGDPTGTGEGGESSYGQPFKDELHSRLRFSRRGMVGMASTGRDDNNSQFFFTLGRADELTNKHTLFGKVAGDTLYNMIRLNDAPTDKEDRPLEPCPKVYKTQILSNPFDDLVPRIDQRVLDAREDKAQSQSKATKNFSLLSFGEEAEEDDVEANDTSKELRIRSSHDVLTADPKLSSEPALDSSELLKDDRKRKRSQEPDEDESDDKFDQRMRAKVRKRLGYAAASGEQGGGSGTTEPGGGASGGEEEEWDWDDDRKRRREELRREARELQRELRDARRRREAAAREPSQEEKDKDLPESVRDMRKEMDGYKKKMAPGKGGDRELQTLQMLTKFKSKLLSARVPRDGEGGEGGEGGEDETEKQEDSEKSSVTWLEHHLAFHDDSPVLAKDANMQGADTYDIYDPRNPLNKRRRGADDKPSGRRKHQDRTT